MKSLKPFLDADLDLQRRVVNFLAGQHVPALRALSVEANNGAVTLRGNVRSFFEKQLSHHSAKRVAGVQRVIDEVEVIWPRRTPGSTLVVDVSPTRSPSTIFI